MSAINQAFGALLAGDNEMAWDRLLEEFTQRNAFADSRSDGRERVEMMLRHFGGRRIIHGHTPISYMTRQPPGEVTGPLIYAGGLCVNVDGGIYRGSPGFILRL